MSKKMSHKSSNQEQQYRPNNNGPAGFNKLEYRGNKFDHVNDLMRFTQLWEVYTSKAFPPRMETIIKDGQLPIITPIDEEHLGES